jgi:branched-chain amino acid aminotransferase
MAIWPGTEAGGTNTFVVWKTRTGGIQMNTAPLESGLVLPGITWKSILTLATTRFAIYSHWDLNGKTVQAEPVEVTEKDFTVHDLVEASNDGRLLAAFAVGTAYFVKEVVEINFRGQSINIGADIIPHPALLRKWLSDIMYGAEQNKWAKILEE